MTALVLPTTCEAHLEIVQPVREPFVFCGKGRQIEVVFQNIGNEDFDAPVSVRIFQASSSTLAPVGPEQDWKDLRVLAGQKTIESAAFEFPNVRAMTVFQIQWLNGSHSVIGKSTVHVLPTNVLAQISVLTSNTVVGVIDPSDGLKPLLTHCGVKFRELSETKPLNDFNGKLVLVAPSADAQMVVAGLKAEAKYRVTVVWMRDLAQRVAALPNMYFTQAGQAQVAVVDATLFADLDHSALAQINLLRCIETAQHPENLQLPTAKVQSE